MRQIQGTSRMSMRLRMKIRDEGMVKNKAVYTALSINVEGIKDMRTY